MVDPDDVEAIALERALHDLLVASRRLAQPESALVTWFDTVLACLVHQQCPGRPLDWVMLLCARRVIADIHQSL